LAIISGAETAGLPAISWQIGAAKEELPQLPTDNWQLPSAKCSVKLRKHFWRRSAKLWNTEKSTQKTKDLRHELAEMAG